MVESASASLAIADFAVVVAGVAVAAVGSLGTRRAPPSSVPVPMAWPVASVAVHVVAIAIMRGSINEVESMIPEGGL